jgi:hypothetical protein
MRVFISWSGDLSRRVAEALRQYLPLMIQGVEAFMSKHDLESGTRWSLELAKELEASSFGILCLTPDNLDSNWMLFEAGALTKHVEGRVCGLLIGGLKPTDVAGPLSQFQNRSFARNEVEVLLRDINTASEKPLTTPQLDTIFDKWWPDIESAYNSALESTDGISKRIPRDQRDLIEEILTRIRAIEGAIERKSMSFTMGAMLDQAWAAMTRRQKALLLKIAQSSEGGTPITARDIERGDLDMLRETGWIQETDEGLFLFHKLIAEFLLNKATGNEY